MRALGWASAVLVAVSVAILLSPVPAAAALGAAGASASARPAPAVSSLFDRPGNLLITDQFNNRVIEVDPLTKQIVWSFGSGNGHLCNPGPHAIIGSNYAERLSQGFTVTAGTGIPPGQPGTTACVDNRVIVVSSAGTIVWQYGRAGVTGSGFDELNVPVSVVQLANHNFLITDQGNNRVIQVNFDKQVVWSYGPKSGPGALNSPNSAERLANGDTLIADEGNNRVIEVNHAGQIVWQFSRGILLAAFASRLANGNTLITDSGHARILIVTPDKQVVFQYFTNRSPGSKASPLPTNAVKIVGGDIVIADQFNDRVLVINPAKQTVFQYGETNEHGTGFDELFGPYTAFEIGDYTGQTPPPPTLR